MLLIHATDVATGKIVDVYHHVNNEGTLTEEHHIDVFTKGRMGAPAGKLILSLVLDHDAATELKRHL